MATYVTSDLHGYPFEKFMGLLTDSGFGQEDFLCILGDVIDRGNDGARYLEWLLTVDCERILKKVLTNYFCCANIELISRLDNCIKFN